LLVALIITLAFSSAETSSVTCSEISVFNEEKNEARLDKAEVIRLANSAGEEILGRRLKDINAEEIKKAVETSSIIERAHVYKTVVRDSSKYRGTLGVKVKYRKPALRVISDKESYYLDVDGNKFPTSTDYSVNVMLVSGNVKEEAVREQILPFVLHIADDKFWSSQIKQIFVNNNKELLLTPLVGNHIIEFGEATDYKKKLRNLMAFYEQVLQGKNWDKYEKISLKYNGQIVAKKR
ncbi:MAG: hypothetical protein FWG22_05650, partial [Prolixibacteraceae bacterium]|nr:hypothetical protein [Prolixibacteraceae bacterium]